MVGVTVTCNHDVGDSVASRQVRLVPPAATSAPVGLDPGFALTHPCRQVAVCGASLPRSGASDVTIAFLAFVTAAAANDGDGNGTPLDRSAPVPGDSNGADDVFLAAVVNTERTISGQAVPTAFTQGLAPVFRDQRCIRCHSFHYPDGWRVAGHFGAQPPGTNEGCKECHKDADILVPGSPPASVSWLAPDEGQTIQPTQDFRGKTDRELYDLVMSKPDPRAHLRFDDRILWAIGHGRVPFRGPADGGRVPMEPQHWQNMVEAWAQAGMQFSTSSAISDIVLASRRSSVNAAGDGASSQPGIAFVPNPGYTPGAPTTTALGTVFVAFASTSTNLTAATATTRNVFRAAVEVWLLPSGAIDLRFLAGQTTVVSTSASGGIDTNGDSDSPAIDGSGNLIAFTSVATNLVPGFADGVAVRSNVWLRDMGSGGKTLLSHAMASATQGGNGDSKAPAISATGGVVAFESDADDLVAGDGNGNRDVFVVRTGVGGDVLRASVRSGGEEATGGGSGHAAVFRDAATDVVFVAFQSSADFGGGAAVPAVFVHELGTSFTQRLGAATATLREPRFTPGGSRLWFVSDAALDTVRADQNGIDDVIALDFAAFRSTGLQDFERATVAATGNDADAASLGAAAGGFVRQDGSFNTDELIVFTTAAGNVGRSPVSDVVVDFVMDRTIPRVVAEFTSEVHRGVVPFAMSFQDLSNNATAWSWDFGDGGTSTEQNPTHVYTVPGDYTVMLTVSGTVGSAVATKPAFANATATPRSWATIYAENALNQACAGCHVGPVNTSTFSMTTAAIARTNMVGVNAVFSCTTQKRVLDGNAAQSVLVSAISESPQCVTFRMGSLSPQALRDVIDWINHGVPP